MDVRKYKDDDGREIWEVQGEFCPVCTSDDHEYAEGYTGTTIYKCLNCGNTFVYDVEDNISTIAADQIKK